MSLLARHAKTLGLDYEDIERAKKELIKAQHMTREELVKGIAIKEDAVRILRIQQAAYLAILETRT